MDIDDDRGEQPAAAKPMRRIPEALAQQTDRDAIASEHIQRRGLLRTMRAFLSSPLLP
ncbi:hypothetical protein ACNQFN_17380 [Thauera butanivorans]|uniref:hypothetical protein n=1 Tax=Thauera butanivorans TaxID=86174 RepID=UPI003AB6BB09